MILDSDTDVSSRLSVCVTLFLLPLYLYGHLKGIIVIFESFRVVKQKSWTELEFYCGCSDLWMNRRYLHAAYL